MTPESKPRASFGGRWTYGILIVAFLFVLMPFLFWNETWYPKIVPLAADPVDEIRVTDVWVMGQDNTSDEFHHALLQMLNDPNVMVQRNAALSLVRFKDDAGHALILAMLRPYEMTSPLTGTLDTRLKAGDIVNPGTMVAHIEAGGRKNEVRATVPGTLIRWLAEDHGDVVAGQPVVTLGA